VASVAEYGSDKLNKGACLRLEIDTIRHCHVPAMIIYGNGVCASHPVKRCPTDVTYDIIHKKVPVCLYHTGTSSQDSKSRGRGPQRLAGRNIQIQIFSKLPLIKRTLLWESLDLDPESEKWSGEQRGTLERTPAVLLLLLL
jgi:hypothetical protein